MGEKTLRNFHTTCPLSLSASHPHVMDEDTKGSERGSDLPKITQLDRDKAGLCTKPPHPLEYTWVEEAVRSLFSPEGQKWMEL